MFSMDRHYRIMGASPFVRDQTKFAFIAPRGFEGSCEPSELLSYAAVRFRPSPFNDARCRRRVEIFDLDPIRAASPAVRAIRAASRRCLLTPCGMSARRLSRRPSRRGVRKTGCPGAPCAGATREWRGDHPIAGGGDRARRPQAHRSV
jgi:hypothetical protein